MTTEELTAIRERAERAKSGKWTYVEMDNVIVTEDPDWNYAPEIAEGFSHVWDAEFIAHARTDIPLLLAEITRLRAAIAEIADYEAPFGLDATGYEVLRIMARQALDNGGDTE